MTSSLAQGLRLRSLRKSRRLTQQDACEELGLTLRELFLYEKGRKSPSLVVWQRLSAFYDVPLEELMREPQATCLGDYLVQLRQERRLTQSEVALAAGISERSLIFYERGERQPKLHALTQLAAFYQLPVTDFLRWSTSESATPTTGSHQIYQFLTQWEQGQSEPLTPQEVDALIYQLSMQLQQLRGMEHQPLVAHAR